MEAEQEKLVTEKATTETRPFVVAGIPAYNEEKTIARVVLKAQEYADVNHYVCKPLSADELNIISNKINMINC